MIARLLAVALAAAASITSAAAIAQMPSRAAPFGYAAPPSTFRAPRLAPLDAVSLPAPSQKSAPRPAANGPRRIASVRALDAPVPILGWVEVAGGFVAKVRVTSADALGLRVRLDLGAVPGDMEVRAVGIDGRIQTLLLDPTLGPQVWTPWTEGDTQVIELFSPVLPGNDEAVRIGAVLHFDAPMEPKAAAGACTLETMCAAVDTTLDPGMARAIEQREKSVVYLQFVTNGAGFVCTGTLINTEKFPAPYVLTANHCIDSDEVARTITTRWFYESDDACPGLGLPPAIGTVSGGMQLVFTNFNVDSTLLLMNQPPPAGAVYAGWNPARLSSGDAMVSISHPQGDTARYAVGAVSQEYRVSDWPQEMYGVHFSRGIIQGGSSGSGLFTLAGGSLELRGILTGTTVHGSGGGLSCTDLNEDALYSRFEIFEPEIEPYITLAGRAQDDAPNRPQDLFAVPASAEEALDKRSTPFARDGLRIDYPGDLDVFRIVLAAPAWVSAWTEGANLDTVGTLLDAKGVEIDVNDDAQAADNHFGITHRLDAGTYYLQVAHWDASGTGAYNLRMRADHPDTNYTDLWWNPDESGWGINLDHQDSTIFATLFTYDATGEPMWLVMSNGARQADGTYSGTLYRTTGPAFNAVPFGAVSRLAVGTMSLAFSGPDSATLTYSYNGRTVVKSITRQVFSTPPACTWSAFDRSFATNYQDLWWDPNEPGWGVNIAHQGDMIFATLFTYEASGKGMWLVMSNGARTAGGAYSGTLYSTRGPAFYASPWSPVSATAVGTMTLSFSNGNAGTISYTVNGVEVTKPIQRQVFGVLKTECEP